MISLKTNTRSWIPALGQCQSVQICQQDSSTQEDHLVKEKTSEPNPFLYLYAYSRVLYFNWDILFLWPKMFVQMIYWNSSWKVHHVQKKNLVDWKSCPTWVTHTGIGRFSFLVHHLCPKHFVMGVPKTCLLFKCLNMQGMNNLKPHGVCFYDHSDP